MTLTLVIFLLTVFFGVFAYRRPTFEKKLLKKIPLVDWMNVLVLPIVLFLLLDSIVLMILQRKHMGITDIEDYISISFFVCALILTYIGNTIHFCGKALSRYIPHNKHDIVFQVNEVFHANLSHYMSFMGSLVTLFTLAIIELNYPLPQSMNRAQFTLILLTGILSGVAATKGVLMWHGANYRPISWLNFILLVILEAIFRLNNLSYHDYQFATFYIGFMITMFAMFATRTIMILTQLDAKRRLKYIAKLVSLQ